VTGVRVYVSGMGIVSPLGASLSETREALRLGRKGLGPLTLFPTARGSGCLVGEVSEPVDAASVPRTHGFARMAAAQAMAECREPPDAVVIGTTTGGMLTTEALLRESVRDPALYRYHSLGSVAEDIARRYQCAGPVITVSTACSSGAVAIKVALEMLRSGRARRILAGGADSLCRLTYYGFSALQLIDPEGARPLDRERRGMSLAEGAAMLLLVANDPDHAIAELLGAGVSCDAYHPTAPDPRGKGALKAMEAAVEDAGISVADIGYVNLHGTATPDNDLSEARAVNALFADHRPLVSSIKGAVGHALGAAGAIEAVVSAIAVSEDLVPANIGCESPDPELGLDPVRVPLRMAPSAVLSNSFGFGGNNACLVVGPPGKYGTASAGRAPCHPLAVLGSACITGAGDTRGTLDGLSQGQPCQGMLSLAEISKDLPPGDVRRLRRLPRLILSLAVAAHQDSGRKDYPSSVFAGTGWGALSETHNFLKGLYESGERFSSPTDFVGSVHNAPACQVAMRFKAVGANMTTTGGDYSFEQSLMVAGLMAGETHGTILVIGADEAHPELSALFDRSVLPEATLSDGGGALCLARRMGGSGPCVGLVFFENGENNARVISSLVRALGGPEGVTARYGAVFAGIPGACRKEGEEQLGAFLALTRFKGPVIDYRRLTGEFATASAVATVAACRFVAQDGIPGSLFGDKDFPLHRKGGLVLGLGGFVTAVEIAPQ
jgi:3-oxoacyl-(acyl-carrier-protein) synthase